MKRSSVPTVVLIAAVALVALLVYGVVQQQSGVGSDALDKAVADGKLPTAPARDVMRPSVDGKAPKSLDSYAGKIVIVNFFASWCEPCKTEAPILNKTQEQLDRAGDGTIVGVTYHDAADAAADFAKQERLTFPLLRDPGDKLFDGFGNRGIPETFVLDKRGRVVAISRGGLEDSTFLDDALAKARAAS